jgi:hypothetical protein
MCKRSIALAAAIALGTLAGSSVALAQTTNAAPGRKVLGFQDSRTGNFHPLGKSIDAAVEPDIATTAYTGTIEVTVTITLKTALPTGDKVACNVDAIATSASTTTSANVVIDESATAAATVSGSTATCKVNIPFSWVLLTPSTTVVNSLDGSLDVIMYSPTATTLSTILADLVRDHSQAITINGGKPGDGTLSVSVAVTI